MGGTAQMATSCFSVIKQTDPTPTAGNYTWDDYNAFYIRFYSDGVMTIATIINGSRSDFSERWTTDTPTFGMYFSVRLVFYPFTKSIQLYRGDMLASSIPLASPTLPGTL